MTSPDRSGERQAVSVWEMRIIPQENVSKDRYGAIQFSVWE
jgi:hypothetical protein